MLKCDRVEQQLAAPRLGSSGQLEGAPTDYQVAPNLASVLCSDYSLVSSASSVPLNLGFFAVSLSMTASSVISFRFTPVVGPAVPFVAAFFFLTSPVRSFASFEAASSRARISAGDSPNNFPRMPP